VTSEIRVIISLVEMNNYRTIRKAMHAQSFDHYPHAADWAALAAAAENAWVEEQWKPGDVVITKDGANRLERGATTWCDENDQVYSDTDIDVLRYNGKLHAHIRDQVLRLAV
jgi:uncharacterized protein YaiI (UPF0178 family)